MKGPLKIIGSAPQYHKTFIVLEFNSESKQRKLN